MPNTYVALRTETVAVATPSVTFSLSGISGYTDLVLVTSAKNNTGAQYRLQLSFNGDRGTSIYSVTKLTGNGSTAISSRASNATYGAILIGTIGSTNFDNAITHIMNYSNTTTNKTVLSRGNETAAEVNAEVGLWRSTAAITSLTLDLEGGINFVVGSTFSLYGIANADQGAAKATGGIITEDSQYWYHTFGASGAFVPKQALTCDYLVVAGGGSGGKGLTNNTVPTVDKTGGGGAGGYVSSVTASGGGGAALSPLSLTAIPYAITVGGGGTNTTGGSGNGSNSVFSSITAIGGGQGGNSQAGATSSSNGQAGGSGGGGVGASGTRSGGARTINQGFAGGSGSSDEATYRSHGGGGGAGSVGANGSTAAPTVDGDGGAGLSNSINGAAVTRAVGGGGGSKGNGVSAVANTGNGGGGAVGPGAGGNGVPGAGGSGIVIIRYSK